MSRLPLETLSIVNDTLPDVQGQQAAVMLRTWHHLADAPDREALFAAVSGDAHQNLIEAFLAALRQRVQARWPRLRLSSQVCDEHGAALQQAFRRALADVLGRRANPLVLNAWTLTLGDFLAELCPAPAAAGGREPQG